MLRLFQSATQPLHKTIRSQPYTNRHGRTQTAASISHGRRPRVNDEG